jgi:hypothetical protein
MLCVGECDVKIRSQRRWLSFYISMKRYQNRCVTFPVKYRETFYNLLPPIKKGILNFLTMPLVAETFMKANEALLGTVESIDQAIDRVKPDLVIVPCAFNDCFPLDVLKSARKKGATTLLLMFNWDNVSSKGVLPFLPDYMTVWGPQTYEQAVKIHKMPSHRVKVLGAPQFEFYRRPAQMMPEDIKRKNGIPLDKKVLLFTGMSRLIDEIGLLERLEKAIESKELPDVHVHYRPHPWKVIYPGEKNFFDCGFKHITMDVQMKDHYVKLMSDLEYRQRRQNTFFTPEYSYYPSLFNAVDAVISPGSTMGIEAMVMGKPVLIKGFGDEDKTLNVDRMIYTYAHHDCWPKMPTSILCRDRNDFINDCRKLLDLAGRPDVASRLKSEVGYVVFQDQKPYAERLKEYVGEIFNEVITQRTV